MSRFRKIFAIVIMVCIMFLMNISSLALSHVSNPSTTTGALAYDSSVYDVVSAGVSSTYSAGVYARCEWDCK